MDAPAQKPSTAWQPLTPRGVAAFARASLGRLLLVQFCIAIFTEATTVWFLQHSWYPVISKAIDQLPAQGEIRSGQLDWRGDSPMPLADNSFLALAVDLAHTGGARLPAHLQVEFGRTEVRIFSLAGFVQCRYSPQSRLAFNRTELKPWWGAWAPPILAISAGLVLVWLLMSWAVLATIYFLPVWLVAFFANRELSLAGSWRMCGAALMPGALFLTAALLGYGMGLLDLVRLLAAAGAHFLVGWGFIIAGLVALPRVLTGVPPKQNPFTPPGPASSPPPCPP